MRHAIFQCSVDIFNKCHKLQRGHYVGLSILAILNLGG